MLHIAAGSRRRLTLGGQCADPRQSPVDAAFDGVPLCLGVGYGINSEELPIAPNPRACFWGGWGGSIVINDLDARLTVAYVMNRMGDGTTGDDRGIGVALATFLALMG